MKNGQKALMIVGGIAAVGVSSFILTKDDPNSKVHQFYANLFGVDRNVSGAKEVIPELPKVEPTIQTQTTSTTTSYPCASYNKEAFPIGKGMKGTITKKIQENLNTRYKEKLAVDGCFGSLTEAAVKRAIAKTVVSTDDYLVILGKPKATSVDFDILNLHTWGW